LAALNASGLVDVIVLARGGGSLDDLAAFNTERVARAIVASQLPVVSAIGHETDFTIADFVADLRAPTPSAAAELITEAQHRIADQLANLSARLERAARYQMLKARQELDSFPIDRAEWRVTNLLHRLDQQLDDYAFRMETAVGGRIRQRQLEVVDLSAGVLRQDPGRNLGVARERLMVCRTQMERAHERGLRAIGTELSAMSARLYSLSPLAVLERGYALVLDMDGEVVRSTTQLVTGDQLTTRLSDGTFTSRVEKKARMKSPKK
jgi:exodeoxyribonuclease VII large subunit